MAAIALQHIESLDVPRDLKPFESSNTSLLYDGPADEKFGSPKSDYSDVLKTPKSSFEAPTILVVVPTHPQNGEQTIEGVPPPYSPKPAPSEALSATEARRAGSPTPTEHPDASPAMAEGVALRRTESTPKEYRALEGLPPLLSPFQKMGGTNVQRRNSAAGRRPAGRVKLISSATLFDLGRLAADLAIFPGIGQAITTLEMVYTSVAKVSHNQASCLRLADKAKGIFGLIREHSDAEGTKLKKAIDDVHRKLVRIHADFTEWGSHNFVTGWLWRDAIASGLAAHEASLDEVVKLVQLAATLQTHAMVKELLVAQRVLKETPPNTKEHQDAQEQLHNMRTNKHALKLPPDLGCECVKVGTQAAYAGSRHDIWKGLWLGRIPVALKFNRLVRVDHESSKKRFERQVSIWRRLKNPYVLPLHGWCKMEDGDVCLVSPWMDNGCITKYIREKQPGTDDLLRLIKEIAIGLDYLHKESIYHGALRPSNVLIQDHGHAVVADFSLSKEMKDGAMQTEGQQQTTAFRYQAPETGENSLLSAAGDVYSWAMTALEVVSGKVPFFKFTTPSSLLREIYGNSGTPQQEDYACEAFDKYPALWPMLAQCWNADKDLRPTLEIIIDTLTNMK